MIQTGLPAVLYKTSMKNIFQTCSKID